MTVRGAVETQELGVMLSHEHVFINLYRQYQPHRDMHLHDRDLAEQELLLFAAMGGGTIVDLTTPDIGRDPAALLEISEATGLNVIMGSGRYRTPFYEDAIESMSTQELADRFIADIVHGVDGVRPGVIGEVGTNLPFVNPAEERVHRAAARASLATGLPIVTHSLGSDVGLQQLQIFAEEGVRADRVAIGHADTWPDIQYHRALLDLGASLIFDTLRGKVAYETARTIGLVAAAVEAGYGDRILLSHDVCGTSHYAAYGGEGYGYVTGRFLRELGDAGIPAVEAQAMVTANPQRFYAMQDVRVVDGSH
jgi:phosphotriesterase-related protein